MSELIEDRGREEPINNIGSIYDKTKTNEISVVNVEMLSAYWEIGRFIVVT